MDRDRPRFLAAVSLALHYYRDVLRMRVLGEKADLANEDLRNRIAADARKIPVESLTRRGRVVEENPAAPQSKVPNPHPGACAQHPNAAGAAGAVPGKAPPAEARDERDH